MVFLQNKLNLRVSQKQILTPGLVQMVSVLALNKLELKDMITAEMVENPVLEELDSQIPILDEIAAKEENRDRAEAADEQVNQGEKNDPFDEIDFGAFFRDYLDPGHRTYTDIEAIERPSFENFLARPTTLTDHLMWQLGSLHLSQEVRDAAELIIGNLNQDGYLTATDEELLGIEPKTMAESSPPITGESPLSTLTARAEPSENISEQDSGGIPEIVGAARADEPVAAKTPAAGKNSVNLRLLKPGEHFARTGSFTGISREAMQEALVVVQGLDPVGVAARDLRECMLLQLKRHQQQAGTDGNEVEETVTDCIAIVDLHLRALQNKQYREIAKAIQRPLDAVMQACDYLKRLDPKPGSRYNQVEARLIEPDVAFVKHSDEWVVMMNEDDVPQLRLNTSYKRLMNKETAEKDVRNYVKERYKSAIQLIKNIEQRKQTILKVCYCIIERQCDFLERGIDFLKPMMIKEVAEEIGVHPSTVSRAVANKYAHTPQGVFELRYFFSESVNGPEGGATSLLILKRRVKKLIEDEDPGKPLTDDQITGILQSQGIQVTRRTVAKYREDMKIPSTHQRRVKN